MTRTGWICPKCNASLSPDERQCHCAGLGTILPTIPIWPGTNPQDAQPRPLPLCGCQPNTVCLNAACPHRAIIRFSVAHRARAQ